MRLLLAIFAILSMPAMASENTDDKAAIENAIEDYFDGIGAADATRLNRAFAAENAAMVGVIKHQDGVRELKSWPDMEAVIANWAGNENPEGTGRDGEILDMKIVDGSIAMVMFRYKDEYYDVLTLVKVDGVWKIATKTFVQR